MKHVLRLTAVLAVVVLAFAAQPALAQVVGSMHDLGSGGAGGFTATNTDQVCVFCHTPHQAAAANSQDPLWNHSLSAVASYGVYGSTTMNAVPTDIGGAVAGAAPVSNLCMSCHDGTVGVGTLYKDPTTGTPDNSATTISGSALVGTSLTDDHPVNFTYDAALATADTELVTPNSATSVDAGGNIPLFGATVQCASCHDPHDTTNTPFLVVSNANSALCTSCHQK
jgi:predicted CXXCH cytochrome family protein